MFFGGEDYNNYRSNNELLKGPNNIPVTRRKRHLINALFTNNYVPPVQPINLYDRPVYGGGLNNYPSNQYLRKYYGDDSRLLDNPNFVNLVYATAQVSCMIIVVMLGLFATISLAISGSFSTYIIRLYVWISFLMIIFTIILGVYLCYSNERNTDYEQRHLMIMYRYYTPNNPKSFSTHFIDTLQVHLECCGSNSPGDLNFLTSGAVVTMYSNWLPRSCCARNRDELIAPWIRNRPTPYGLSSAGGYGNECSLATIPNEHKKGCLNLVREMVQTWYIIIMLWCLLTVIFLLISIITGNQIKNENTYITAGR